MKLENIRCFDRKGPSFLDTYTTHPPTKADAHFVCSIEGADGRYHSIEVDRHVKSFVPLTPRLAIKAALLKEGDDIDEWDCPLTGGGEIPKALVLKSERLLRSRETSTKNLEILVYNVVVPTFWERHLIETEKGGIGDVGVRCRHTKDC